MENEPTSLPEARSKKWIWAVVSIGLLCAAFACCLLLSIAGIFTFRTIQSNQLTVQENETATPFTGNLPALNHNAEPIFGSIDLQRGFTPDPYTVPALGGGTVNTSTYDLNCGFTDSVPTLSFNLRGGASEGFLRIFFVNGGGVDTTLLVRTPDNEWLCADDSDYGSGVDPVIDFEFAPSGEYNIWVGSWESNTSATGSIYITQSEDTTP